MVAKVKISELLIDLDNIINNVKPSSEEGFRILQMDILKLRDKYKGIHNCVSWIEYTEK